MANLVWPIITIGFLLTIPAFLARLLRGAGCPGWSVLGGLLAGILLGPQILGALMPQSYERHVLGGYEQHQTLNQVESRQGADLLSAKHAGIDPGDLADMQTRHEQEHHAAKHSLDAARWDHQRFMRWAVLVLTGVVLLGSGYVDASKGDLRTSLPAAMSIGLWSATLPAASIIAAMMCWWEGPISELLIIAAALAIGPWALTAIDRTAADEAEINGALLIQTAGRIASIIAIALAGAGIFLRGGVADLILLAPLIALPLGWIVPIAVSHRVFESVLIPALAASVAFKADLFGEIAIWPLIIILLLSDDGRWIAAFCGAMIPGGRRALRTMRLTLGSMSAGPTQLAVTAIGAHYNLISHSLILPLMLGVALIEVTAPARRGMAQRLAETEDEFDKLDAE